MRKIILIIVMLAVIGGGVCWVKQHGDEAAKPAAAKADEDDSGGIKISRDDKGNAVITMDDDTQGDNGITVAKVEAAQFDRELRGYGRVLDPTPLATLLSELASARAAYVASSNELARTKVLAMQGNASVRVVQTAETVALRDELAVQSANDRLALGWGNAIAQQSDPAAFLKSLTSLQRALVRVDLPGGETVAATPGAVRIVSLGGKESEGKFLDAAPNVDPQTQGRGFIFLVETNTAGLAPGEAITGFIKLQGEPLPGAVVPRGSVVRTEGSGWVYVLQGNAEDFVRVPIALDRPVTNGWFVTDGVTASNYVVTRGAQMMLSAELRGAAKPAE